jgi:chemotaxis protein CheC
LKITISIPALAIDMAGAILSVPAIHFSQMSDNVLIIQNEFIENVEATKVDGYFFLIPDLDSYEVLLGSLGVTL